MGSLPRRVKQQLPLEKRPDPSGASGNLMVHLCLRICVEMRGELSPSDGEEMEAMHLMTLPDYKVYHATTASCSSRYHLPQLELPSSSACYSDYSFGVYTYHECSSHARGDLTGESVILTNAGRAERSANPPAALIRNVRWSSQV